MPAETPSTMLVECTECHFSQIVGHDDEKLPAEHLREHGERTGYSLTVTRLRDG